MTNSPGIRFNRTANGELKSVTIDLEKYGDEIRPFLVKVEIEERENFEKEWKNGISIDDTFQQLEEKIHEKWKARKS